jgi:acyl-coenzyme A synthetase/AMP-(fatty) acid ligase
MKPAIKRSIGDIGKFEALRTVISAGAVLTAPHHGWMQGAFNEHAVCCSGSGGTDICGTCAYSPFSDTLCIT